MAVKARLMVGDSRAMPKLESGALGGGKDT